VVSKPVTKPVVKPVAPKTTVAKPAATMAGFKKADAASMAKVPNPATALQTAVRNSVGFQPGDTNVDLYPGGVTGGKPTMEGFKQADEASMDAYRKAVESGSIPGSKTGSRGAPPTIPNPVAPDQGGPNPDEQKFMDETVTPLMQTQVADNLVPLKGKQQYDRVNNLNAVNANALPGGPNLPGANVPSGNSDKTSGKVAQQEGDEAGSEYDYLVNKYKNAYGNALSKYDLQVQQATQDAERLAQEAYIAREQTTRTMGNVLTAQGLQNTGYREIAKNRNQAKFGKAQQGVLRDFNRTVEDTNQATSDLAFNYNQDLEDAFMNYKSKAAGISKHTVNRKQYSKRER
jgi:hypothetical protein